MSVPLRVDLGRLVERSARKASYRRLAAIDSADAGRDQERAAFIAHGAERERQRSAEEGLVA